MTTTLIRSAAVLLLTAATAPMALAQAAPARQRGTAQKWACTRQAPR